MSEDTFRIVVTVAVCLASLSMIIQAGIVFGIFRTIKAVQEKVNHITDRALPILETTRRMLDEARPKIDELTSTALEVAAIAKAQVVRIDELLIEATDRARLQIARFDGMLGDTVDRVQETTAAVQSTLMRPVREVNGVLTGVRAALSVLTRGNRASVDHATQDEEMFI